MPSTDIRNRPWFCIGFLLLAAGFLVLPICLNGIPSGNDLPQHYRFAIAFHDSIQTGVLYPGWGSAANHGFGDVGIRFYPPFSYYVMYVFRSVTGDWFAASVLTFYALFFVGGLGVYYWSREWFDESSSLAAGILYMILPYHANQLFNAFLFAEFAAAAVLPFCFLFAARVWRKPNLSNVLLLGASYAALILTHIPTTLIGSAGLAVYCLVLLKSSSERIKTAFAWVGAAVAGVLLSSFYWIKLATETYLVKHNSAEFASRAFDFKSNFLLSYFTVSGSEYLDRSLWFADMMLLLTLIASVPAAVLYFRESREHQGRSGVIAVSATLALGFFLATPLSSIVWVYAPLLAKIQFPFRWMALVTLAAALIAAAGTRPILNMFVGSRRPIALVVTGGISLAVAFTAFQVIRPAIFIDQESFSSLTARLRGSEGCECWWPVWANKNAFRQREPAAAPDRLLFTATTSESGSCSFHFDDGLQGTIRIPVFYYPHWKATVNDQASPTRPDETGAILVDIPDGPVMVGLSFQEPYYVIAARLISAISCLLLIVLAVFGKKITSSKRKVAYE